MAKHPELSKSDNTNKNSILKDQPEKFDHKTFLASLSTKPGVYRMLDSTGKVLYVGKARNLKSRVSSYFHASGLTTKTLALVNKIANIEITVTNSETEALLLEQTLIKQERPAYNIQLRDDKSYPYIFLTDQDKYPRLAFYRGSRRRKGRFFGPYPSAHATRETLQILQKVFRVRQCEDSYFSNRSRPCLQYQIERCTAPCVGLVSTQDYARDVRYSTLFLQGKSDQLQQELNADMEQAAQAQKFEKAAKIRDQLIDLRRIQEQQYVANRGGNADILAAELSQPYVCVHVIYVRGGRITGNKSHYPRFRLAENSQQVLSAFVSQAYLSEVKTPRIPQEIIVGEQLDDSEQLQAALSYVAGRKIKLAQRVRGHRAKWLQLARTNARESLQVTINQKSNISLRFKELKSSLKLDSEPRRIECFDISHTGGEHTVGACVVFDNSGPVKADYRRYQLRDITPGDDYAAMEQVLDRRFTRLVKDQAPLPDILLIDGGKGQLNKASKVLQKFALPEVLLLGIAKGISRRAGQETLFLASGDRLREFALDTHSPALHLLQQVRDEAHRFAITGHRQKRGKSQKASILEQIPGLGPKRRRELLKHFGGHREVVKASEEELAKVAGISRKLAENIYAYLHNS